MYRVMIVDDEPLIREGLRTIIDWEAHGFLVADAVAGAAEALRRFPEAEPRLMIVDIRMPGMDGLELLRVVQERFRPCPRFLILSGHADFEYARTAMQLKVDGYLLKPIDEEELAKYLKHVRETLDADRTETSKAEGREDAIEKLLSGESGVSPEAVGLSWSSYEVVLIKLLGRNELDAAVVAQAKRRLAERLGRAGEGTVFPAEPYIGVLLKDSAGRPSALSRIHRLIAGVCEEAGTDFDAASGGAVAHPTELQRSFQKARELMKLRFLFAGGEVYTSAPELPRGAAEDEANGADATELEEKLFLALDAANADVAEAALRRLGAIWLAAGAPEQEIKTGFAARMSAALSKLSLSRPELREFVQSFDSELVSLYAEYRYGQLIDRLVSVVARVTGKLSVAGAGPDKQVQRMIELIRRNSSENLKLESLAEVLGYNSSYLGKLFKNVTGDPFNTYLDKVRIEKAKELLRQGMKVYQVAEKVGYANVDYFHAKFRKYVGMSPIAYRKNASDSRCGPAE
ncbi:response regulator [Cohnella hongkongensis]|uniref:Response regulator n=1 Tax=Cohnella hongkongensis TaxID=178337 RepID=A0ABV9F850_9BACL